MSSPLHRTPIFARTSPSNADWMAPVLAGLPFRLPIAYREHPSLLRSSSADSPSTGVLPDVVPVYCAAAAPLLTPRPSELSVVHCMISSVFPIAIIAHSVTEHLGTEWDGEQHPHDSPVHL